MFLEVEKLAKDLSCCLFINLFYSVPEDTLLVYFTCVENSDILRFNELKITFINDKELFEELDEEKRCGNVRKKFYIFHSSDFQETLFLIGALIEDESEYSSPTFCVSFRYFSIISIFDHKYLSTVNLTYVSDRSFQ